MDGMGHEQFDIGEDLDFAIAWDLDEPFVMLKSSLYEAAAHSSDFKPDYPYDAVFNRVCASGLIRDAFNTDRFIEIRYGWEMLDKSNIILHSCSGYVADYEITVDGGEPGFLMEIPGDGIAAFKYSSIFWVGQGIEE
jgi:hypothetical protein